MHPPQMIFHIHGKLRAISVKCPPPFQKWKVGWVVHFCFGLGFMFIFEGLWVITPNYKTLLWGLAVGGFMGLLGIVGWMAMFYLHPRKPNINFTLYYVQLFFAHIIFSITAFGIYKSFE